MKLIKAILSGKGLPRKGEKGFTLIELLIVLAILAVLAAVVIPNVTGMFGRGAEQAYDTDLKTIQTSVSTFYFDVHGGYNSTDDEWQDTAGTDGHYYPTMYGDDTYDGTFKAAPGTAVDPDNTSNYRIARALLATDYMTDLEVSDAALWFGLLINSPAAEGAGIDGSTNAERTDVAVSTGEKGPYLNEIPDSAMAVITGVVPGNGGTAGTYLWVIGENGKVYGIYRTAADTWYIGFSTTYP